MTTDGGALVGRNRRDHHRVLELRGQVVNVRVVIKDFGGHTCELSNRLEDPRNVVQLAGVCLRARHEDVDLFRHRVELTYRGRPGKVLLVDGEL